MSTFQKRLLSCLYWLIGYVVVVAGSVVGFLWCWFMAGFRHAADIHKDSVDIWDEKYNDPEYRHEAQKPN